MRASVTRADVPVLAAAFAIAVVRILTLPRGFWEAEEIAFARALLTFDPAHDQPHAPGFPLFVAIGRLVNVFVHEPATSLVTLSVAASIAGAILFARAGSVLTGAGWSGANAALILYFGPAALVFTALPNAEATTLAFLGAAFLALVRGQAFLFAAATACAIGCDPDIAAAGVLLFAAGFRVLRASRTTALLFAAILAIAFIPLAGDGGGYQRFTVHAADTERFLRFVAHPWGPKYLSFPLLAVAAAGAVRLLVGRPASARRGPAEPGPHTGTRGAAVAVALFALVHTLWCILTAPMTDGVQPVLPALAAIALLAGGVPRIAIAVAVLYAAGSLAYALPFLDVRRTQLSPPIAAVRAAEEVGARRILAEAAVLPHAQTSGLDVALLKDLGGETGEGLYMLSDGRSAAPGAQVFEWPDSDLYGKITSERYRVASLVPLPPSRRYRGTIGVYPYESAPERGEFRWLAQNAVIDLPDVAASTVTLHLALPPDAPVETNRMSIGSRSVDVPRGGDATLEVPATRRLIIHSDRAFQRTGDPRSIAVQLLWLEQQ